MSPQYGELRPTSGWDRSGSLGLPCKFQRVSRLCSVTAQHCSSGRQPNFVALNIGRQLYSAGRPSRWALAHISSFSYCTAVVYSNNNYSNNKWKVRVADTVTMCTYQLAFLSSLHASSIAKQSNQRKYEPVRKLELTALAGWNLTVSDNCYWRWTLFKVIDNWLALFNDCAVIGTWHTLSQKSSHLLTVCNFVKS